MGGDIAASAFFSKSFMTSKSLLFLILVLGTFGRKRIEGIDTTLYKISATIYY